jgi:hypothetical protein
MKDRESKKEKKKKHRSRGKGEGNPPAVTPRGSFWPKADFQHPGVVAW